jgi:leucine dehydrogenase
MLESLLPSWDGEHVLIRYDRPTGAWILTAIHSTRLGPAGGGTRMKSYPHLAAALKDVLRLARGMTYKFAVGGVEMGGGKTVIALPADFDPQQRTALLHRYGTLIQQLRGSFYTGPDVGTSSADMDTIATTGAPYVFGRSPAAGGAGDSGPYTALGVFSGIQATCAHLYHSSSLHDRRILIQGVGSVGRALADRLVAAGAEVLVSDVNAEIAHALAAHLGVQIIPPDAVYTTECDIFAPCALGGILNRTTIPLLRCRAVAGAANNQLATPEDAAALGNRNILYAPDYVINVGGALAVTGIEAKGWSVAEAENRVVANIDHALREIFALAKSEDITTEQAAQRIAGARLAAA